MALKAPTLKAGLRADGLGVREMAREEARKRRAEETGKAQTMRAWAVLVPERGVPLDLEHFPYQAEWYSEEVARAREVVVMKAAQVGMSAYAWRWAARRAEQFNDTVIYFFPTDDDVSDFGDQRIEPSIEDSAYLLRRIPPSFVRQKHLKQIGGGWLALRGTQSKTAVQSVDADALVFDEYDYLHQGNLAHAERRLAGAMASGREPRIRRFGYPTIADTGIHARYKRSDRRVWHVTCPECGLEQPITWQENMRWRSRPEDEVQRWGHDDYEDRDEVVEAWRACRDCDASLEGDGGAIYTGRWIAQSPESAVIGFHVSRLIVPRVDLIELVKNSRDTSATGQETFWNNDLGEPYSPSEAALTAQDVDAACSIGDLMVGHYPRGRNIILGGLDVASERNLTMWVDQITPDGQPRSLWVGEPTDFKEVAEKMKDLRVALLVVDSMPERRSARALAVTFPGRVVLAQYDDNNKADAFKYDPKKNMVTINRTEAIDAFFDSVRNLHRALPKDPPRKFKPQLLAPKRQTVEDTAGRQKRVYVSTGSEGDDFAHAGVYVLVAREMWRFKTAVEEATKAARGEQIPDENLGFTEEYHAGFGEGGKY